MKRNVRVAVGAMAIMLAIGLVTLVVFRATRQDAIAVQLVDMQQASSGNWRITVIVTNQSAGVIPTFATRDTQATPQPTTGEPMCWIESLTATGWKRLGSTPGLLTYTRVLPPKSSWRFETDFQDSNQRQRLVLSYLVGRIEMPQLLERLYLALRRSPIAVWDPTPRFLNCDLPAATKAVVPAGASPLSPGPE